MSFTDEAIALELKHEMPNNPVEGAAMKSCQFTVVIEPDGEAFHAYVPALPGCHTFGATIEEAQANIKEAIGLHIEGMLEDNEPLPVEREPMFITRLSVPVAV